MEGKKYLPLHPESKLVDVSLLKDYMKKNRPRKDNSSKNLFLTGQTKKIIFVSIKTPN